MVSTRPPAIRLRDDQRPTCFSSAANTASATARAPTPRATSANAPNPMRGPKYTPAAARKNQRGREEAPTVNLFHGAWNPDPELSADVRLGAYYRTTRPTQPIASRMPPVQKHGVYGGDGMTDESDRHLTDQPVRVDQDHGTRIELGDKSLGANTRRGRGVQKEKTPREVECGERPSSLNQAGVLRRVRAPNARRASDG